MADELTWSERVVTSKVGPAFLHVQNLFLLSIAQQWDECRRNDMYTVNIGAERRYEIGPISSLESRTRDELSRDMLHLGGGARVEPGLTYVAHQSACNSGFRHC